MMTESNRLAHKDLTLGDAAVDGLLSGIAAGIVMAVYLIVVGLVTGEAPGMVLSRFDPGEKPSPLTGALMHLAVAGVYGMLFALGRRLIVRRWPFNTSLSWLAGLAYGLVLLILATTVILPGTGSPLREIPFPHFAVTHVLYGLTLGALMGRQARSE